MALDRLKNIRKSEQERIASYDRVKPDRLPFKAGDEVFIVFLEEIEATAETHTVREWAVNGNGKFRSLLDTTETEGSCYAEELRRKFKELDLDKTKFSAKVGWKVYFNIVTVKEPGKPLFFSQPATSPVVEALLEDAEEEGGITGVVYRLRKGAAQSDSWQIKRMPKEPVPEITAKPYSIDDLLIKVDLDKQPGYLAAVVPEQLESRTDVNVNAGSGNVTSTTTTSMDSSDEW